MTERKLIKEVYVPAQPVPKSPKHPEVHTPKAPPKDTTPQPPQGGGIPAAEAPKPPAKPSKNADTTADTRG